jgi:8-oxo-dGTP pyrophosphatase MutT (NUDIX family)
MDAIRYASLLPLGFTTAGKVYILLATEQDSGLYSDFGGSPERGESVVDAAVREGMEESHAQFTPKVLSDYPIAGVVRMPQSVHILISVPWDVEYRLNVAYALFRKCGYPCSNGCGEKGYARWFDLDEIPLIMHLCRPEFHPTLHRISGQKSKLISLARYWEEE